MGRQAGSEIFLQKVLWKDCVVTSTNSCECIELLFDINSSKSRNASVILLEVKFIIMGEYYLLIIGLILENDTQIDNIIY